MSYPTYRADKVLILSVRSSKNINKVNIFLRISHDPINFINESFDFDFCKIIFDGEKLISNYFNEIINKTSNISLSYLKSCLNIDSYLAKYRIT